MPNNLIGIWLTDPNDTITQHYYGDVEIEFQPNGELIYTIKDNGTKKMYMKYEIEGDLLITDQPSYPNKQTTKFNLTDKTLELFFNGIKSKYIKII